MAALSRSLSPRELLRRERVRIMSVVAARGGNAIRIFGSVARGDHDPSSDIDLLVDLPEGQSRASELLTALALSEELSQLLGTRIDVVTPRTLREEIRDSAISEAIPL
jgi:predicted nucleotidyltransferase